MGMTKQDMIRASRDPKFVAARWKERVARSEQMLDKTLSSNASRDEKEKELYMHRKRIEKMKEVQKEAKR